MDALAVLLEAPERVSLRPLALRALGDTDVLVETAFSGVSTGTEKLLWTGRMPDFPGMGYPLVPGYESVGRVTDAGGSARALIGRFVFVPGASCYLDAKGLFGSTAARLIAPAARVLPISAELRERGTLIALAATALHALDGEHLPDLIVGHGVLGRLLARITLALGGTAPTVWETTPERREGDHEYPVIDPVMDSRRDYRSIVDVSGDPAILDLLVAHMGRGGEIVLAGFYERPLTLTFPPAFMKEARVRIAAEFTPADLGEVGALIGAGKLNLENLITHVRPATEAADAYPAAFVDRSCLKMVLDWGTAQ